jgi:hypothetical protein
VEFLQSSSERLDASVIGSELRIVHYNAMFTERVFWRASDQAWFAPSKPVLRRHRKHKRRTRAGQPDAAGAPPNAEGGAPPEPATPPTPKDPDPDDP